MNTSDDILNGTTSIFLDDSHCLFNFTKSIQSDVNLECRRLFSPSGIVLFSSISRTMGFETIYELLQNNLLESGFEVYPFLVSYFAPLHHQY